MANFKSAFETTMSIEGGYSNNPKDKGGETYKGISRHYFSLWKGWLLIDNFKSEPDWIKSSETNFRLQLLVQDLYKTEFWDRMSLDDLNNQDMANELFDTAVNMGVATSGNFFQRAINVSNVDGKGNSLFADLIVDNNIGKNTIKCFNILSAQYQTMVFKLFNCLQGVRYINICEVDKTKKLFMFGWSKRVVY